MFKKGNKKIEEENKESKTENKEENKIKGNRKKKSSKLKEDEKKKENEEVSEGDDDTEEDEDEEQAKPKKGRKVKDPKKDEKLKDKESKDNEKKEDKKEKDDLKESKGNRDVKNVAPDLDSAVLEVLASTFLAGERFRPLGKDEVNDQPMAIMGNDTGVFDKDGQYQHRWLFLKNGLNGFVTFKTNRSEPVPIFTLEGKSEHQIKIINMYRKAWELFGPDVLVTRMIQNEEGPIKLPPVGEPPKENYIKLAEVEGSKRTTNQRVDQAVQDVFGLIIAYINTKGAIAMTPGKLDTQFWEPFAREIEDVLRMRLSPDDNAHPIMLLYQNKIPWLRDEIRALFPPGSVVLGEIEAAPSRNGIKQTSIFGMTVDQFMAKILNINFREMEDMAMYPEEFIEMLRPCVMSDLTDLYNRSPTNEKQYLCKRPSPEEMNALWFMLMTSPKARVRVMNDMAKIITDTNRLKMLPADKILDGLSNPRSGVGTEIKSALNTFINRGTAQGFAEIMVLETFAGQYTPRLSEPRFTGSEQSIIGLVAILSMFVVTPKIAQSTILELGYHISNHLSRLVGAAVYERFSSVHGWYKTWRQDERGRGEWVIYRQNKCQLNTALYNDGVMPSIFVPCEIPAVLAREARDLYNLIMAIRQFVEETRLYEVPLNVKRAAQFYPYTYENFIGLSSYAETTVEQYVNGIEGTCSERVRAIGGILRSAYNLWYRVNAPGAVNVNPDSFYSSLMTLLEDVANGATPLFNVTCRKVQEFILNSPLYVDERGRLGPGVDGRPYMVTPRLLGFRGETVVVNQGGNMVPRDANPIPVTNPVVDIGIYSAFSILLCGRGDFETGANMLSTRGTDPLDTKNRLARHSKDIKAVDHEFLYKRVESMFAYAQKTMGTMAFIYYLTHPNAPNHPFEAQARLINGYLMMSNWTTLVNKFADLFGTEGASEFLGYVRPNGVVDSRFLVHMLILLNKENTFEELPPLPESRFGVQHEIFTRYDHSRLQVIASLYLSNQSVLKNLSTGVVIGRFIVEQRQPRIPDHVINEQYPHQVRLENVITRRLNDHNGNYMEFEIPNLPVVRSLVDNRVKGTLIICAKGSDITANDDVYKFIKQGVAYGNIAIKIEDKRIRYDIDDKASKTEAYDEDEAGTIFTDMMSQTDGSEFYHMFTNTPYATNFSTVQSQVSLYIQSLSLVEEPRNTVITAVNSNTIAPPEQHIPIDRNKFIFGDRDPQTNDCFIDGVNKLTLPPNFNNAVCTVTTEVMQDGIAIGSVHKSLLENVQNA